MFGADFRHIRRTKRSAAMGIAKSTSALASLVTAKVLCGTAHSVQTVVECIVVTSALLELDMAFDFLGNGGGILIKFPCYELEGFPFCQ